MHHVIEVDKNGAPFIHLSLSRFYFTFRLLQRPILSLLFYIQSNISRSHLKYLLFYFSFFDKGKFVPEILVHLLIGREIDID